jgi:ribosome-associated translation inhibitor RaiA
MKETTQQIRERIRKQGERIDAYNKYVEDTAVRTENTVSKFWAKDVHVAIKLDTTGVAFGGEGISISNAASIASAVQRLDKLEKEINKAKQELDLVKDDGGLNNGRIL